MVVITGTVAIVIAKPVLAVPPTLSDRPTVKPIGPPAVVGVPAITPPVERVNPAGNVPETNVQVNGMTPPETARVCE